MLELNIKKVIYEKDTLSNNNNVVTILTERRSETIEFAQFDKTELGLQVEILVSTANDKKQFIAMLVFFTKSQESKWKQINTPTYSFHNLKQTIPAIEEKNIPVEMLT